ncbi:MAG: hypothetical protein WAK31_12400 [Chthoniobacterales bacterium]|jgi:hypothetical protein
MLSTRNLFVILSLILIMTFLWRAFTPSHEYPMHTVQLMTMGFDLLCLVGVIGCWINLSPEYRAHAVPRVLCLVAVVAGIGLWAIRLHSQDSWATGHIVYYLEPR